MNYQPFFFYLAKFAGLPFIRVLRHPNFSYILFPRSIRAFVADVLSNSVITGR
jgi:hypothetical protein